MRFLICLQATVVLGIASALTCSLPAAEKWTSADGYLSVEIPDNTEFRQVENPPEPFIVLWVNKAESCKLGVMSIANANGTPLSQKSVESGLAEEIGGVVERLPTKKFGHKSLWAMVAKKDDNLSLSQTVTVVPGKIYKSMGLATDSKMADVAFKFIDTTSVSDPVKDKVDAMREQVRQAANSAKNAPAVSRNPQNVKVMDSNQQISNTQFLSKAIGGVSTVVAIISAILWFARRNMKR